MKCPKCGADNIKDADFNFICTETLKGVKN